MATPTSLNPAASSFKAFAPPLHSQASLTRAINVLWGLSVAYFAGCTAYCAYNLYYAYQCYQHTSFNLPDECKLVKCEALLLEAGEKTAVKEVQPLLQQCEALLEATTARFHSDKKEELTLKLAQHYAKADPEHAYTIAQRLTSNYKLFNAAQSIQKECRDFDQIRLSTLYLRAWNARRIEKEHSKFVDINSDVDWLLKLAEAFYGVNDPIEAINRIAEASKLALTLEHLNVQMRAFCNIAKCCHMTKMQNPMQLNLEEAQALLSQIHPEKQVPARLMLANTFLDVESFSIMDQQLREIVTLFETYPATLHQNLYAFSVLIKRIEIDSTIVSDYKKYPLEPLLEKIHDQLKSLDFAEQNEAFLCLATIYQEKLVKNEAREQEMLNAAFSAIINLRPTSESSRTYKTNLLTRLALLYKGKPGELESIFQTLRDLYKECPVEADSRENYDKSRLGQRIIQLYNKMGLGAASEPFFRQYLKDCDDQKEEKSAFNKISRLTADHSLFENVSSQEQTRIKLETAEELFSQLGSSSERSIARANIAQGYLQVDRQKSLAILTDVENSQGRTSLITTAVFVAIMGTTYLYPGASPLILLGIAVLQHY